MALYDRVEGQRRQSNNLLHPQEFSQKVHNDTQVVNTEEVDKSHIKPSL